MTPATPITEADLPSHPEPHSHAWTEAEKRCILAWGNALVSSATEHSAVAEALMPKVGFCRVGDAVGGCAVMLGQPEDAMLYTADQMHEAIRAATERAAKLCDEQADFHQLTHNTQAEQAAGACAAVIRIRASSGREGT